MSTDAERLAALLDDALYRDEGIWKDAGKADTDAIAARLIAAGVGFPADGLDVEAARKLGIVQGEQNAIETLGQIVLAAGGEVRVPDNLRVRDVTMATDWENGQTVYRARLQSEAPAPEDPLTILLRHDAQPTAPEDV